MIPVFILLCGLVIDGGGRLTAERQAESVAAQASRAGAAAEPLGGRLGVKRQAEAALRARGVTGTVRIENNVVVVDTRIEYRTQFLSVTGITTLTGRGHASATLVPAEPS